MKPKPSEVMSMVVRMDFSFHNASTWKYGRVEGRAVSVEVCDNEVRRWSASRADRRDTGWQVTACE